MQFFVSLNDIKTTYKTSTNCFIKALNNWSTTVDLQSAIDLLASCSNNGDFGYVFVYALSALQSSLNKCAAIITVKELTQVKQTLVNLLNSGKLNGFNIIKGKV